MKINQLFIKHVEKDLVMRLLRCYNLNGFDDKKTFSKFDLEGSDTVTQIHDTVMDDLRACYLPCKSKVYLDNLDIKKSITVLKQVIRLHGYYLNSKEKTCNNKKVMFYNLAPEKEKKQSNRIEYIKIDCIIDFK